jgi:hypothetical protein
LRATTAPGTLAEQGMGTSERESGQEAQTSEMFVRRGPSAEVLDGVRGFRVEWEDGSVGIAGGLAIFVRTAGFGSGHRKLELLTGDDVVAILPRKRRILVAVASAAR